MIGLVELQACLYHLVDTANTFTTCSVISNVNKYTHGMPGIGILLTLKYNVYI